MMVGRQKIIGLQVVSKRYLSSLMGAVQVSRRVASVGLLRCWVVKAELLLVPLVT
jgi:hypothetical protein